MIAERIVLSLKSLELLLKKIVNKYNNYTYEHDEHMLYQNKKEVKIMWIIVSYDSRNDSLVIEITKIIFEKKKLTSTIITFVNMMSIFCIKIKIKRKSKNNVDNC